MEASLQGIFTACYADYARDKRLPLRTHKAARALMQCRTAQLGGHVQRCPEGHVMQIQYNSCRHRSCPRCAALPKARWVESEQARLLACDHYHVVFTLPHELVGLWEMNRRWFADALFQASRDTLMTLLQDPTHLGARPGIMMALHTWGRTLSAHPHVHCLVSGGGLTPQGNWKAVNNGYLLPVRVVKALYKGKLLSRVWRALKAGELKLREGESRESVERLLRIVARKSWNVRLQERYAHGRGVMLYLSRYVKGGPISDRQILSANRHQVSFSYKDHRDGKKKRMVLSAEYFMERVLWHAPEPGQHTIRHYGLYGHHARAKRAECRRAIGQAPEPAESVELDWQTFLEKNQKTAQATCPICGARLVAGMIIKRGYGKNSIAAGERSGNVQQVVQVTTKSRPFDIAGPPENVH
jgi:hypothetical protein